MQPDSYPPVRDLVLVGGGHAHALVLRMWGMNPLPGARVTVINPGPVAPYTGMLPGHIAGHYTRDEMMIDLVRLARFAGARVILDRAEGIDRDARRIILQGRPPLRYDIASLDIGISSDLAGVPGFAAHATAAKPLGDYAAEWEAFVARGLATPRIVVVGAGVGGVELALASAHRLTSRGARPEIRLLEQGAAPLAGIGEGARRALLARLKDYGIALLTNARPATIAADHVTLADGRQVGADFVLSVAGAQPQAWLAGTGLRLDGGFVAVDAQLQTSDPAIFAAGDCAHLAFAPRPKAGVFAVREAPVLFHNLRAALTDGRMRAFRPQRDYLKLISTGDRTAVADKFGLKIDGGWLWTWKDRIDRAFMRKFTDFPAMPAPALPAARVPGLAEAIGPKPLCGGCGAKLPAGTLGTVLGRIARPSRADVVAGAGDDAAILTHGRGFQVITTDHLRTFTEDHRLMARVAANHALGDIWAMGAQPQAALAQITLPRMGDEIAAASLAEIMEEAAQVIRAAGADLVGGHTSVGAELTIGFTVTGLADRPVTKGGAAPGDALILTKPLGTGVILAAEMARSTAPGLLLGEAVAAAFASMTQSLGPAAGILLPHAHAMTDVTGFGLAGHLLEMLDAANLAARLSTAEVPLLPGALALAAAGAGSSLLPANRAATLGRVRLSDATRAALFHDPQTCGGLLAAVPADRADDCLAALTAAGETAAIIGTLVPGAPAISD